MITLKCSQDIIESYVNTVYNINNLRNLISTRNEHSSPQNDTRPHQLSI